MTSLEHRLHISNRNGFNWPERKAMTDSTEKTWLTGWTQHLPVQNGIAFEMSVILNIISSFLTYCRL